MNISEQLENIKSAFAILVGLAITVGMAIITYYCSTIGFIPSNTDIGDGLFFILTSLVFGVKLLIAIAFISMAGQSIYYFTYKLLNLFKFDVSDFSPPSRLKDLLPSHIIFLLVLSIVLINIIKTGFKGYDDIFRILLILVVSWGNAVALNNIPSNNSLNWYTKGSILLVTVLILPFFMIPGFTNMMISSSLKDIGIIQIDKTIIIKEEQVNVITKAAESNKCEIKHDEKDKGLLIANVDILFHGYGDSSKVRINSNKKPCFSINLPNDSFIITEQALVKK